MNARNSKLLVCIATVVALATGADARYHHRKARASGSAESSQDFAYYLLALSWAPDFCVLPNVPKDPRECGKGRKVGFIVHGLWPQGEQTRGPERCGPASPVSQEIVRVMLNYIPTESLIQHEWANHGTCSGLTAAAYFAQVRKARDSVTIPAEFKAPTSELHLSPDEILAKFEQANPKFPKGAFRVSCQNGGLQEARICFNKDLTPRACGNSVGACNAGNIFAHPVQ